MDEQITSFKQIRNVYKNRPTVRHEVQVWLYMVAG